MHRNFAILILIVIISLILWPRLPLQDRPEYFDFADFNSLFGIPNWQNVLSNLPFLYVGILGLKKIKNHPLQEDFDYAGVLFAVALLLTAFGSSHFHWDPNPQTLFWDRLPMALIFGSLICLITIDRLFRLKTIVINFVCMISLLTVVNWTYGNHDLRPYITLQFLGGIYIFFITAFTKSRRLTNQTIFVSLAFYVLAKFLETYDRAIFQMLGFTSGHALKHLSAAVSAYGILNPWNKHPLPKKS